MAQRKRVKWCCRAACKAFPIVMFGRSNFGSHCEIVIVERSFRLVAPSTREADKARWASDITLSGAVRRAPARQRMLSDEYQPDRRCGRCLLTTQGALRNRRALVAPLALA